MPVSKLSIDRSPKSVLATEKLYSRSPRAPDLEAEVRAFHELSTTLLKGAKRTVQRFLHLALELCEAGSAGLSLLEHDETTNLKFRWTAIAGEYSRYVGGTTPREFSPCGLCLDEGTTILVHRPARVFEYFKSTETPIIEGLIVPLYDTGREPLGTLWIISHSEDRLFDATDARVMEQLAVQLVLALKWQRVLRRAETRVSALEERTRLVEQDLSFKDALIAEVNHRVKNSVQSSIALLRAQARTVHSQEAREVLVEAQTRLAVFSKVHELLYTSAGSAQTVDMAALLHALAGALRGSFTDRIGQISLDVSSDRIELRPEQAIPLALIVNEAVTNAYKHAYPDGRSGVVTVQLEQRDGALRLCIADDGVGVLSPREGSLGLHLIHDFAQQLAGMLVIDAQNGTSITLTVPEQTDDLSSA